MTFFHDKIAHWKQLLATNFPVAVLKLAIVAWSIMVIILALIVDNPYALAGIFLYEALP